jgi:hypothetical protein
MSLRLEAKPRARNDDTATAGRIGMIALSPFTAPDDALVW